MHKSFNALIISFALAIPASAAAAVPRPAHPTPPSPLVDALAACRSIADKDKRLACYDGASAKFTEAVGSGDVIVMDKQEVKQTRRSLFGYQLPRIPLFRGDSGEEQEEISATIKSIGSIGMGQWRLILDDNSIWRTTEESMREPRAGEKVVIKRGAIGNYFIRIAGRPGIRGLRIG